MSKNYLLFILALFIMLFTNYAIAQSNPSSIAINASGIASPYPSNIVVSGSTGVISNLTVTLTGLSHTFPDDIDILLVGPGGQNAIIMSDVGGDPDVSGLNITLDDAAGPSLPDATTLSSGTFKPSNYAPQFDAFTTPATAPSGGSNLWVFNGTSANGTWKLFIMDDQGGDAGSISGGWTLNITTHAAGTCPAITLSPATLPNGTVGTAYSEALSASGGTGPYTFVTSVGSLTPGLSLSTAGVLSGTPTAPGSYTFSVSAKGATACVGAQTYTHIVNNPSGGAANCNIAPVTIPTSGAASPYPSTITISGVSGTITHVTVDLKGFTHTTPDDVDILLVGPGGQNAIIMSDCGGTAVAVSGLNITLDDAAASSLSDGTGLSSGTFKPTNYNPVTADVFPAPAPAPSGGSALSVFNGTSPNGTWNLYVFDDTGGDFGTLAQGWCVNITAGSVSCPTVPLSPTSLPNATVNTAYSQTISASGGTSPYTFVVSVGSLPPGLTLSTAGLLSGNPTANGTYNFSVTGTDDDGCPGSRSYTIVANNPAPATGPCSTYPVAILDGSAAAPYPTAINFTGLVGNIASMTVTINGFTHTDPSDVDMLLVGPGGQNLIIMSDAGGTSPVSGLNVTFSDAAPGTITGTLTSGTFKPTNNGAGDFFQSPAPSPSGSVLLSIFNGTNPNGDWLLYIMDDTGPDGGSITGWCINITLTVPPVITCPANFSQNNDAGVCNAVVNFTGMHAATATGTPTPTITYSPVSGSTFNVGTTTTVTATATNTGGSTQCTFDVTVNDNENPVALCHNITVQLNPSHTYTVTASEINNGSTDNCGIQSVAIQSGQTTYSCSDVGQTFPVTILVTDIHGRTATCTGNVTVADNTNPCCTPATITNPGNKTANNDLNICSAVVTYTETTTGTAPVNVTYIFTGATIGSGSGDGSGTAFNKGTTNVTLTATNACSAPTVSFTVTVTDNQPPSITCAADVTINNTPGLCTGTTTLTAPTTSDNCITSTGNALNFDGTNDYVERSPLLLGTSNFTIEFWVKATALSSFPVMFGQDKAGTGVPAFRFEVNSSGGNTLTFFMNDAVNTAVINSTATISTGVWTHFAIVRSGNSYTMYKNGVSGGSGTSPGSINQSDNSFPFRIGSRSNASNTFQNPFNGTFDDFRIWNVARTVAQISGNMNNELAGNEAGLVQYYKFNQGTAGGNNTSQANVTATTGANGTFNNFALTGATSNFVAGQTFGPTLTNNAPATYPLGPTTVTWTATDASGNSSTCNQTVTVADNQPPTISCPGNTTVSCTADTAAANNGSATATDNCSGTITYTWTNAVAAGDCPNHFTITRTWKATDASGNSSTCNQTITVNDQTPPVITCPDNTTVSCTADTAAANNGTATATDNCGTVTITWSNSITNMTCANRYTITRTWTATDVCGNSSTCSQTITVDDQTPPTITCPTDITLTANNAGCTATGLSIGSPVVSDNCGGVPSVSNNAPVVFPLGNTVVTWTSMDACGNTASCQQTVTVIKSVSISTSKTNITCYGLTNGTINVTVLTGTPPITYQWNTGATTQNRTALAAGTYTVTVTDANGCSVTASQTIILPTQLVVTGTVTNVKCNGGSDGKVTATPSGGTPPYTYSWSNGVTLASNDGLAAGVYTCTIKDSKNCQKTLTASVTQPPVLSLTIAKTNVTTIGGSNGTATANPAGGTPAYTYSWSNGKSTKTITGLTASTYTVTVTDSKTCTKTGSVTITQPGPRQIIAMDINDNLISSILLNPNPTRGITYLEVEANAITECVLRIFDLQGRMLYENKIHLLKGNNRTELNLEGFASSVYFVNIVYGDKSKNIRVVKE